MTMHTHMHVCIYIRCIFKYIHVKPVVTIATYYICIYFSVCSTGVWVPHIPKIGGIEDAEVRITACTLYMCVLPVCLANKGRIGDSPVVPSREVVLFQRFSLKI